MSHDRVAVCARITTLALRRPCQPRAETRRDRPGRARRMPRRASVRDCACPSESRTPCSPPSRLPWRSEPGSDRCVRSGTGARRYPTTCESGDALSRSPRWARRVRTAYEVRQHGWERRTLYALRRLGPPLTEPCKQFFVLGNAFWSLAIPAGVTFVLSRISSLRFDNPERWTNPASVTFVPLRASLSRLVTPARWASPASVTWRLLRNKTRSFLPRTDVSPISVTRVSLRYNSSISVRASILLYAVPDVGAEHQAQPQQVWHRRQARQVIIGDLVVREVKAAEVGEPAEKPICSGSRDPSKFL